METKKFSHNDCFEMLNTYITSYNKKYGGNGHMFENIDIKDLTSTNDQTEMFNGYMALHIQLQQEDIQLIDVYNIDTKMENSNNNNIYVLIVNDCPKYKSFSYISLLYIGYKNIGSSKEWNIVEL